MKRTISLRSQLFVLMALLVLLQSLALVSALSVSNVFLLLDAEAFRLFDTTTKSRAQECNASVGQLIGNMATQAQTLGQTIGRVARAAGVGEKLLYRDDDAFQNAALAGTETVLSLLGNNSVSGAFFVMEGSNTDKENPNAHSAVYIRNAATGSAMASTGNYQLEVGTIAVSQQYRVPTSINWRLDMTFPSEGDASAFYHMPIWAAGEYRRAEMERYGFWSKPDNLLGDGQRVVTYTMPLLDADGDAFGVVGVEISLSLFAREYVPNTDLPYQNSFYAIASGGADALDLGWFIPSGPLAQVYLHQGTLLPLRAVAETELYETEVGGLGGMYCSVQPLVMYSRNSPFYSDNWLLTGFVPKDILHETSTGIRQILIVSILVTTAAAFVAIFLLTFITTRKISGLSKNVQGMSPYTDIHFTRTGIREIDELTAAVEKLSRSVINASKTTSKILELTLMPIGGFESSNDTSYVTLTEFVYRLLDIKPGTEVSKEEWRSIHERILSRPAANYEDTYEYVNRDGNQKWLRILETASETGTVGVILDVSKDIAEHRRLAHELDFDALTHLYSRTAFKREAYRRIQTEPSKLGAMIFVDLDNLKYINDTFGHDMGDRLIIRAGEMFRQFERYGGIVARISGDEFSIYLHGFDSKDDIRKVIYQIYTQEEEEFALRTTDGALQKIRFSSGIAFYPNDTDNVTDLLKLSDYAMYEAKHSQKGSVLEFNQESYSKNVYLLENREAINRLLDEGLIRFAFQPIVDLRTGEVFAYEALMRPLLDNFKSPLEIISVASSQSKLNQLERLVMITVMQTIRDLGDALGNAKVFVNSIPSQVLSDEDHLMLVRKYGDIFERLVVEITEIEGNVPERLLKKAEFIHEHGMTLAIDDFGSGYSNEVRILSITPEIVKVDIELIRDIDTSPDRQKLLENLASFCHPKGIRMVAEGVERPEELAEIIRLGVDYVQGYYTGRPNFDIRPVDSKVRKEILSLQALRAR